MRDVLEVRAARLARDLFNAGAEGAKELTAQPTLLPLLLRLVRAQEGEGATLDSLRRRLETKAAGAASGPPGE